MTEMQPLDTDSIDPSEPDGLLDLERSEKCWKGHTIHIVSQYPPHYIKQLVKLATPISNGGLFGTPPGFCTDTCTCQQKLDTKLKKLGIKIEYLYKIQ